MSTDHFKASVPNFLRPLLFSYWQPFPPHFVRSLATAVLCCAVLFMAACGPEAAGADNDTLMVETRRIAQEYETTRNLDLARNQLNALDVANADQWLLFVAETTLSDGSAPESVMGLVRLATDLGLQSAPVVAYAEDNGLIERAAANSAASIAQAAIVVSPAGSAQNSETQPQPAAAEVPPGEGESAAPAAAEIVATATPLAEVAQPTPVPTSTVAANPVLQSDTLMNVRSGPGLAYPVVAALDTGTSVDILGKNQEGDWWQIALPNDGQSGWVFAQLVTTSGDVSAVAIASNIPTPPPATNTPVPPPAEVAPAEPAPAPAEPAPAAPAPGGGPDFRLVEHRVRSVTENGGRFDGPSVICGEKHELTVEIVDANGAPLNGVAVEGIYTGEIFVTGSQGKGDGRVEYVLWSGEDVKVIRDVDGRDVSSDVAAGNTTRPAGISHDQLIQGGFCTDAADCQRFIDLPGCYGHYSWLARFQRNY